MPVTAKEKKIILISLWLGCHNRAEVFFGSGGSFFFPEPSEYTAIKCVTTL